MTIDGAESKHGAQIMVVDDAPDSLKLLSEILSGAGYGVRGSYSGLLALRSVAVKVPDLILLDVKMDEIDGFEVCRRLKAQPASRDIPVIFISGLHDVHSKVKGFESGGIDYIHKPFQAEEVLARVRIHLELRRLQMKLEARVRKRTAELEQAYQALRVSERKFKRIFEEMQSGYLQTCMDGVIEMINPAALRALGYTDAGEIVGRNIAEDVYARPEDRTHLKAMLLESGQIYNYDVDFKRKNGERIQVEANVHILKDRQGQPIAIEGIFQDVTQRKRAEQEREGLIAELQAKNSELERFTYTVSHDLKSPLVTIEGFLGYIAKDAADGNLERLHADIERISRAVKTMNRLLDELLQLSRIGRIINPAEAVAFGDLAHEAVQMVFGRIDLRNVNVHIEPDLPTVVVDRLRVRALLENLVDNACKFMGDQPRPRIDISARREEKRTVFTVRDNGCGIEPQFSDKVFGLFERLNPDVAGTGIGLAIAKQIVTVHGGDIWIESSSDGRGTVFCFTLGQDRPTDN